MEAFFSSVLVVALAEIGDKTQLLAIVLAARFGRPAPILAGILIATLANHFLAALIGAGAAALLDSAAFRYAVAASFVVMAGWALLPDEEDEAGAKSRGGAFVTTLIAFFLVEMGDKTQVATLALGARYQDALMVTLGTTLGMMAANAPAVYAGEALLRRVPLRIVRYAAAAAFLAMGLWLAAETAELFGAAG